MQHVIDFLAANAMLVSLLVGIATPTLTSIVLQPTWSTRIRTLVAGGVSLIVGFLTAAAAGQLDTPENMILTLATVYAAAEAAYHRLYASSGLSQVIEKATSPKVKPEDPYQL